ncbi:maleylpyruvate isomerase family mycothiol-dependent enzyme [Sphaerisporangium perillae]|uniref:maleylpyruvate isomerase family mycothiol-dependent enzyme n=1 Tax=Sphaerisporangium perillae TaxID=2935860 RepID=UPI00200D40C9|nr:maleylpyruvate isomerase family mycothiol-dependent enzyme [Sphaerisporangium perillae]
MTSHSAGDRSHEKYCSALDEEVRRFAGIVEGADPAADVPTCPGWTTAKLLKHVGVTRRWVEHIVRHRLQEPVRPRDVPVTLPPDDKGYPGWLAEGGQTLVATLRAAESGTPVWSWGADHTAGFWSRRMLHETAVHRADAEITLGLEPRVDVATATDGVEEFLGNLSAADWLAGRLAGLGGSGERLHFHATDAAGEWTVTVGADGFTWERGHGKGDVAVRGTAGDLLLLLYGRFKPEEERFELFGDPAPLHNWLSKAAL